MNKIVLFAIFAFFCQISHQNPTQTPSPKPNEKIAYDECGKEYSCFGMPENCMGDKTCEVLLTTEPIDDEQVKFTLFWTRPSNSTDSWVAAGISSDGKMDGAAATVLTLGKDNKVNAQQGETTVGNVTGFTPYDVKGIVVLAHKYIAGQVYAEWIRPQTTTVNKLTFDMKKTKYYILLAYGPMKDGKIQHHTKASVSDKAVDLESDPTIQTPTPSSSKSTTGKGTATPTPTPGTSTGTPASSTPPATTSTPSNSTATATPTAGNSTATGTPSSNSTTSSPEPGSTKKPGGSASALTMSLFLTIFVSILLLLN